MSWSLPALNIYLQLPILIVLISLVYSATRYDEWGSICHEAVRWGGRMVLFLAAIAGVLYLIATLPLSTVLLILSPIGVIVVVYMILNALADSAAKRAHK